MRRTKLKKWHAILGAFIGFCITLSGLSTGDIHDTGAQMLNNHPLAFWISMFGLAISMVSMVIYVWLDGSFTKRNKQRESL